MSKRVIFTCTLILLLGVFGLLDSLLAYSDGRTHVNLLALFLPVAIALFMGVPGSRLAATVVFSIIYLFLVLLVSGVSVWEVHILRPDLPAVSATSFVLLFVAMIGSLLALLHWMLYSPPFDEHLGG